MDAAKVMTFQPRETRIFDVPKETIYRALHDVSPVPPPMMRVHRGRWAFAPEAGGCVVRAVREYELVREPDEPSPAFASRRADFDRAFRERLGRILDSFATHCREGEGIDDS
jgi:hypothetical protein